jgi:hypothetical protein
MHLLSPLPERSTILPKLHFKPEKWRFPASQAQANLELIDLSASIISIDRIMTKGSP